MEKNVCEIIKENSIRKGFLCIIPIPHQIKHLPVLITCNHILGAKDLKQGEEIKIKINNNEKIIKIKNSRRIYTDEKKYDITIIELKPEDNFDKDNMLEIEDDIFNNEILNNLSIILKNKESDFNDVKLEEYLIGHPDPLSKEATLKIFEQMDHNVCKIIKEKSTGTGFLCIIPFPDKLNRLPVLMTCNHVLGEKDLIEGEEIKIEINKNEKILKINNSRKIYTDNKKYDITIIEIKQEDNFDINKILEIEDDIFNNEMLNNIYQKKTIYIIHYPHGKEPKYTVDVIKSINADDVKILHLCSTKNGSSGAPLLNLQTYRVIGMHNGKQNSNNWNIGIVLKFPIIEFNKKYINNFKEIKLNENSSNENKTYINSIYKCKNILLSKSKIKINEESKNKINSIDIEVIDFYVCKIYYKLQKNIITDLGILIKIDIINSKIPLFGILTKYYVEENILSDIKTINIVEKGEIIDKINLDDRFNFSDPFLDVTFIEINNTEYDFMEIYKGKEGPKESILITISNDDNSCIFKKAKIKKKWGVNYLYEEQKNPLDELNLDDFDSSFSDLALLFNEQLVGFHKQRDYQSNIAINIDIIAKAIKLNFENNLKNIKQRGSPLNENQIQELKEIGLELSKTIPNILISLPSIFVTPIWFYRTKYAWYWTPTKPEKNDLNKINWMIIYPGNSLKVIGGQWDGIEPAPKNIDLIHWLEKYGLKFLI